MYAFNVQSFQNKLLFKGAVMQNEKSLINNRLMFQKYPENFASQLLYSFAVIYPWNLLFALNVAYF